MRGLRAVGAACVLLASAVIAFLALHTETCTGAAADSLLLGVGALAFNVLGFGLLGRKQPIAALAIVVVLPVMAAFDYSAFTLQFALGYLTSGITACQALTGLPFELDGREAVQVSIWIGVTGTFWAGLVWATMGSTHTEEFGIERTSED